MEQTGRFAMRVDRNFLSAVDEWRRRQSDIPPRSEAIRRLVELGIGREASESATSGMAAELLRAGEIKFPVSESRTVTITMTEFLEGLAHHSPDGEKRWQRMKFRSAALKDPAILSEDENDDTPSP